MNDIFQYKQLEKFCQTIFRKMGCSLQDAQLSTQVLLSADLRGIDSHGIARLKGYVRLWEKKRINPRSIVRTIQETLSTATVDGDSGFGLVVAPKAMEIAIKKAAKVGTGWVAVRNTNHFGIAGYHAMMALAHDMIGIAMTNASPLVAPTFGKERMLGTNPIAMAIPALKQPHFVADFSTTTAANGKLEILQRKNMNMPQGWAQTLSGGASTDAHEIQKGGALLPLGSDRDRSSHKGYCLGAIVDLLAGVLSGANFGPWVPPFVSFIDPNPNPIGKGIGHFFGAMRVDAFMPAHAFKQRIDQWIERFRNTTPIDAQQPVLIPGDPERAYQKERLKNGIPVLPVVVADLSELAKKFALPAVR